MYVSPTPQSVDPLIAAYWMPPTQDSQGGRTVPQSDSAEQTNEARPRALVVDDAPDVTEMIAMFLQHAGFDPVMAFSAGEALEAAKSEQFEVIVSDIGMPGMNGYDL